MVDRRALRSELDRADVDVGLERRPQHQVPIDVVLAGTEVERARGGDDRVGPPEPPALGPRRRRRPIGGLPFLLAPLDPALDGVNLVVAQPPLAEDRELAALRQPRRHVTLARFLGDAIGVLDGVGVGQQRERRDLARPVARRAVGEQDRRDVLVERDGRGRRRRAAAPGGNSGQQRDGTDIWKFEKLEMWKCAEISRFTHFQISKSRVMQE
jgi:hypothetical protein